MKIIVASSGRAHLLDVARELINIGHDVTFYSYTSKKNCLRYKFPLKHFQSLLPYAALPLCINKFFPSEFSRTFIRNSIDIAMSIQLSKCDIFICQSPYFPRSITKAKSLGIKVLLDRGSTHVRYFEEQRKQYSGGKMPEYYKKLEEKEYQESDYIVVGSQYVADSFIKYGVQSEKLFINNYGVNLNNFKPTTLEKENNYDLIMVGQWSRRKGCDVLASFCEKYQSLRLLHIGHITDKEILPTTDNFTHIEPVKENQLINYYKKAKVFILLSKDEGLALVQLQAIACGLPLVISYQTGGGDLKKKLKNQEWIQIINSHSIQDIYISVTKAIELASTQKGIRSYFNNINHEFSWKAYAERYEYFFKLQIFPYNI